MTIPEKSIGPMSPGVPGSTVDRLQHFIGQGSWDQSAVVEAHQAFVAESLGDPWAVLIVDGTQFEKKGTESAGVARQCFGGLGKVANCQSSVLAAYASPTGCTFVDGLCCTFTSRGSPGTRRREPAALLLTKEQRSEAPVVDT